MFAPGERRLRSPLRIVEGATPGGLGRGDLALWAVDPSVDRTVAAVQTALDHLERDVRVVHVAVDQGADRLHPYYDELSGAVDRVREERHRAILSLESFVRLRPPSRGDLLAKLRELLRSVWEFQQFEADVVLIDGWPVELLAPHGASELRNFAEELGLPVWLFVSVPRGGRASNDLPAPLDLLQDDVSIFAVVDRGPSNVTMQSLRRGEASLGEAFALDPHSLLVEASELPRLSELERSRGKARLCSGGAPGAEEAFGECAERFGVEEVTFSFEGHDKRRRSRGLVLLRPEDLRRGDFSLASASRRLGRSLVEAPSRDVLQVIWHQINAAREVFVVGGILNDGTVRGGTGWGVELARLWHKPVFVFDQDRQTWFEWRDGGWQLRFQVRIRDGSFAGTGTQNLNEAGARAIRELFERSFATVVSRSG